MSLADDLRDAVRESGLSQHQIAKAVGISRPCLVRFMVGKRNLALETVEKLAAFFGMKFTKPEPVCCEASVLTKPAARVIPRETISPGLLYRAMINFGVPTKRVAELAGTTESEIQRHAAEARNAPRS